MQFPDKGHRMSNALVPEDVDMSWCVNKSFQIDDPTSVPAAHEILRAMATCFRPGGPARAEFDLFLSIDAGAGAIVKFSLRGLDDGELARLKALEQCWLLPHGVGAIARPVLVKAPHFSSLLTGHAGPTGGS